MQRIPITREDYAREWGEYPDPDCSGMILYTVYGTPIVEYFFIDEDVAKAEVEWLERLYALNGNC